MRRVLQDHEIDPSESNHDLSCRNFSATMFPSSGRNLTIDILPSKGYLCTLHYERLLFTPGLYALSVSLVDPNNELQRLHKRLGKENPGLDASMSAYTVLVYPKISMDNTALALFFMALVFVAAGWFICRQTVVVDVIAIAWACFQCFTAARASTPGPVTWGRLFSAVLQYPVLIALALPLYSLLRVVLLKEWMQHAVWRMAREAIVLTVGVFMNGALILHLMVISASLWARLVPVTATLLNMAAYLWMVAKLHSAQGEDREFWKSLVERGQILGKTRHRRHALKRNLRKFGGVPGLEEAENEGDGPLPPDDVLAAGAKEAKKGKGRKKSHRLLEEGAEDADPSGAGLLLAESDSDELLSLTESGTDEVDEDDSDVGQFLPKRSAPIEWPPKQQEAEKPQSTEKATRVDEHDPTKTE
eukprot:GAFH01001581.1.p1 GENE.GAFH01001581.1~~GAFH01001581.1.p1  ORF type:complete len:417 (+),score=92.34 GAFH01001581.1:240-1490(+)